MAAHLRCYDEPLSRDPPQIRLLKIESVEAHDDPVRIHTAIADLHEFPIFDALSYVWGDQSVRLAIFLNGEPFEVGNNLYAALKILRTKEKKKFLWIDAICINQCDDSEKNYQVSLMAQIYSKAGSVICWLGEASVDSDLAISSLSKCGHDRNVAMHMALFEPSLSSCNAIQNLIRRPYWTRVWIIQENQLARQRLFLCGNEQIMEDHMFTALDALRLFVRAWKHIADLPDRSSPIGHSAEEVSRFDYFSLNISYIMAESRRPELTRTELIFLLNDLMIETSNFQATDSRDRLYGLLGLLPPDINSLVQPDYTKSTTAVFVDFALLTYKGRFRMIAQSGTGHTHSHRHQTAYNDMPSWVPNYGGQFIEYWQSSFSQGRLRTSRFEAGGLSPPRWCRVPRTLTLRVSGVRAGYVTAVSAPEILLGARMVTWDCHAATMRDRNHPCRNWRQAFYQTLLLDQDRRIIILPSAQDGEEAVVSRLEVVLEKEYLLLMQSAFKYFFSQDRRSRIEQATSAEKLRTLKEEYQYWLEENVSVQVRDLHGGDELRPSLSPIRPTVFDEITNTITRNDFGSNLNRMTKERSFIMTDDGYMGLAPVGTEVEDEIALLLGCPVPLVLRRQADKFQVIGDTYIYGLMEGQVFGGIGARLACIEDLVLQ